MFKTRSGNGTLDIYTPRLSIEYVQQTEISRRYFVALSGERRDIRCQRPYAYWNDADNLVTITKFYTSGPNLHRVKSIEHPDGTMQIFTNEFNAGGDIQTNIVHSGKPNGGKTAITDGTKTVTVTGSVGQLISRTVSDIISGVLLSREIYSNYDEFNRPGRVTYLDGTYEDTQYACCGIDSTTDRDGVVTSYWYDDLKRRTASTRLGITTTNLLDAAGNVLKTTRIGSNNWQIVVQRAGYNLAGERTFVTNALNGVTSFTEAINGSGELVRTNTYPNGSTRIETYYRDGSLKKLGGTAVHPVRYEYGIEYVDPNYYAYTKEIKLDAGGNDTSEWTKTYTDALGRHFRTLHAAASAPYPTSASYYNGVGQLSKTVDPDGVVTLYQYNARGELAYTAVDLDRDDVIDFNGTDRITFTTNWVESLQGTWSGIDARIQRTYAWSTNNSSVSNLVSIITASTDGLNSWQEIQLSPLVSALTSSRTAYSGTNRYVTNSAPDNSHALSHYQNGRLLSVTRKDASHNQITKTTYGYDGHGRQATATDARNGTTTFSYNDADLVTSVTTPNPGTLGGAPQTTTTYYNTTLQATNVVQPDGTSVVTEYHPTGEIKKTWGSRTYPVEYTFDSAGRMKTLKTWQDFVGNSGAATTTWYYHLYRGWLTNKVYADGKGPIYSNTPAGRLALRIGARGTNTTYSFNSCYGFFSDRTSSRTVIVVI